MKITVTAPYGTEIVVEAGAESPDGVDTLLRQITDAYAKLVAIDLALGITTRASAEEMPYVDTELGDDDLLAP